MQIRLFRYREVTMVVKYHVWRNERILCLLIFFIVLGFLTEQISSFLQVQGYNNARRVTIFTNQGSIFSSAISSLLDDNAVATFSLPSNNITIETETTVDRRPHEQRTTGPRAARRMNHGFRYLYRTTSHLYENVTALEYLTRFYSESKVMEMNRTFPPLLDLNVSRHVHPKIRFLQETMLSNQDEKSSEGSATSTHKNIDAPGIINLAKYEIPAQYFGARLEKTIAPSHAFLVYMDLPHGLSLLIRNDDDDNSRRGGKRTKTRWQDFLISCRRTKQFCALCNQWQREKEQKLGKSHVTHGQITSKQIEAFSLIFGRGLMAAARGELVKSSSPWPLEHINITSREILQLSIKHGANPLEKDIRGTTLLHWAAGTGNLEAFETLFPYFPDGLLEKTDRDGATPLHWACAGASSKEFGTGGHYHLCQHILLECDRLKNNSLEKGEIVPTAKELVNHQTKDGNSPLMWAAWSGSLDTVKLMVRYRAKWDLSNRNGCTVAHWAASGGNLDVCKYLAEIVGVDFFVPNNGGNTPLTHAVAFGRIDVVQWLRELAADQEDDGNVLIAKQLAADFATWSDEQPGSDTVQRKKVLKLFEDDYWEG
mmetsp:Transcript_6999/g.14897  ORF Transcript_6999/g.14897 Transcript_6999/m.14897 type:complete len:597 (+) Transcript_6999:66-1856(+)